MHTGSEGGGAQAVTYGCDEHAVPLQTWLMPGAPRKDAAA